MSASPPAAAPPRLPVYYWRAQRLRCPRCGEGRLFVGWFRMHESCADCGLNFHPEPGFYLGSIYLNYGLTALLALGAYLALFLLTPWSPTTNLLLVSLLAALFPLWFFRRARALWLALDRYFDRS